MGRSFYTWHVTFDDQPAVHRLAADYAPVLDDLPTLDPIPVRWLHLTMQGIGFTDEVSRADVDAVADAARHRCAALAPFTITLGPARVDPEALMLPVRPVEPVTRLRATIRAAIADVWEPDNVPEDADGFRPHVSLAYSNATGPAEPIIRRLGAQSVTAADITVHRAALIEQQPPRYAVTSSSDTPVDTGPGCKGRHTGRLRYRYELVVGPHRPLPCCACRPPSPAPLRRRSALLGRHTGGQPRRQFALEALNAYAVAHQDSSIRNEANTRGALAAARVARGEVDGATEALAPVPV